MCFDKLQKSLHKVIDPNSTSEDLKQEKIKKANGYLALGVVVAVSAVALLALGIAVAAVLNPGGLALSLLAVPVFWLGHTICMYAVNYKNIINRSPLYWNEQIQHPDEYRIKLDMSQGTLLHRVFSDPKVKESFEKVVEKRLRLKALQQEFKELQDKS